MMQRPPTNSTANARHRLRTGSRQKAVSWLSVPHRLLRMQHQLAGPKTAPQRAPHYLRLLGAVAMTDRIVRVTLEWNVRELPRHPHVEHAMQEQVRQQR